MKLVIYPDIVAWQACGGQDGLRERSHFHLTNNVLKRTIIVNGFSDQPLGACHTHIFITIQLKIECLLLAIKLIQVNSDTLFNSFNVDQCSQKFSQIFFTFLFLKNKIFNAFRKILIDFLKVHSLTMTSLTQKDGNQRVI